MTGQTDENQWLTAAECAERLGLTVRALRVYESRGLISPRRTGKNWRLYGAEEFARLNEIVALKRLGLSLSRITALLGGQTADLDRTLALQQSTLIDLHERVERSLNLIAASRQKIAAGESVSITELIDIAKETKMTDASSDAVAWRRYEQAKPRKEVQVEPSLLPEYEGAYQFGFGAIMTITRRKGGLSAQLTGQPIIDIYPEREDHFFYKIVPAQLSFVRDAEGNVASLVLHQNGYEQIAPRLEDEAAKSAADALEKRVRDKVPLPGSEALLRRLIDEHQRGEPDYDRMSPPLAELAREQAATIEADLARLGPLQSVSFKGVAQDGWDVYDVKFANGALEWAFALGADGKFSGIYLRPLL
ncbi:Mercuric resistance operon regulatory protein [Ensifer psoraleae]|uniref:MerR family transcriptional regulator n=1 Tax=Sinorhizobium psoraleae TaxID=520838 RepID=UPI00156A30EA|nr:MerR family transcriptional regulator [Sinorhizobium psoraleae]NRP70672.1 Mercuric resistance operon regulatory protein [Sinorhizobium psoraleae]